MAAIPSNSLRDQIKVFRRVQSFRKGAPSSSMLRTNSAKQISLSFAVTSMRHYSPYKRIIIRPMALLKMQIASELIFAYYVLIILNPDLENFSPKPCIEKLYKGQKVASEFEIFYCRIKRISEKHRENRTPANVEQYSIYRSSKFINKMLHTNVRSQ